MQAVLAALNLIVAARNDSNPANDMEVVLAGGWPGCPSTERPRIICPGGHTGAVSVAIREAISDAVDAGVTVVAGGSNWGEELDQYGAGYADILAVSAIVDTDGLPGSLGPDGKVCQAGDIQPDGPTVVTDDWLNPFSGWGTRIDLAAPGSCSSTALALTGGGAALLASAVHPDSRADVEGIRNTLRTAGNYDWVDDSGDGDHEPLLDVGDAVAFDPDLLEIRTTQHVFYRGANGQLNQYGVSTSGVTHTQLGYGGHMNGDPSAVVSLDGKKRYVFYKDATGQLHQYWEQGAIWNHSVHGGMNHMGGNPAAIVGPDGTRHVFYRGANGQLNQYTFGPSGETHTQLGYAGHMIGDPTAVLGHDGRRYVFYQDATGQLHQYWEQGAEWNHSVHGELGHATGAPAITLDAENKRSVFYPGVSGSLNRYEEWGQEWDLDAMDGTNNVVGDPAVVTTSTWVSP